MSASSRLGATALSGCDRVPQSSRVADAGCRALSDRRPSWSAPISNRLRQLPSWRPSLKPTPASPRSRGKASTRSSAADARRGPLSWRSASKDGVRRDLARAVVDASGTWTTPNPLGASGCRPWAKPSSPIGSPMAFRIFSAAIVISMRVERRSSSGRATRPPTRCSNSPNSRKLSRALRFCGRHEAPISREFIAAATPTNCRRAANSARTFGRLSTAGA